MKRLLALAARVVYFLGYPLFGLYLHNSRRTRVLILCDDEILLHRSYAGNQKWSLPGGGIHKNENPMLAAIREVKEEVGIYLNEGELQCIGEDRLPNYRRWPRYAVVFYVAHVPKKQAIKIRRPLEVIESSWFAVTDIPSNTSSTVQVALKHYKSLLRSK